MNLLQQFAHFLADQKNKPSLSTSKNYKADIGQFINWFEEEFKSLFDPAKITLQTIEQYKKTRTLSPSSIQRHISSLRKFFSFLKISGVINFELFPPQGDKDKTEADPWMLRNFKSYLYEYKKSNLTIKNYINDIRSFFLWFTEVSLVKHVWNATEKNLLNRINFAVVEEYKERLIAAKFSPRTINRKLSSLRNYINWARKEKLISDGISNVENEKILTRKFGNSDSLTSKNQAIEKPASVESSLPLQENPTKYSHFPPLRLIQKTVNGANSLFDALFIFPLLKSIENIQYLSWKVSGKRIFTKPSADSPSIMPVLNIQKKFYTPLGISTRYLPIYGRIWHYLHHIRPNWYKKYHSYSITHYLHFAILITLASAIGFGTYSGVFADRQKESAILGTTSFAPPRILSFQGKLTDSSDNPITTAVNVLFSIYSDQKSPNTASLWQENTLVKPDSNGIFSALLGNNALLPDTLFSQNPKLFLGITVGDGPELNPRQQLATTPFANNSETLQGLEPITNTTKTNNVVLALDSIGNLNIAGSKSHTFQAIGGQFVLSGNILSLTTVPGSNGKIEIIPDGIGKIDLLKPIQNSSNNNNLLSAIGAVEFDDNVAILATTSAQSAFYINQNSTGPLISASTSGIAKFTVENDGKGMFSGDLEVNGKNLTSSSSTFNLLNTGVATLNIGGEATSLILGTASGSAAIQSNIFLGSSDTNSITFTGRVAQNSSLIPITADGTNDLGSPSLPWDNAYINNIYAVRLDLQASQPSAAITQIFNTDTGTDANGLLLKLGNTSTDTISSNNHFINFETSGIGVAGSVQGSGGKGVTYATSGIADFAEYLKKDKNQTIEYGSVVCIDKSGLVVKCDTSNNNILGVASERPAFLGGENLGDKSIAVGLVGQVETLASIDNGPIKAGDVLTAFHIPGVAVKSTKAGQIMGKALENLDSIDESRVVGFYDPDSKEYRNKDTFPNIPIKPNIVKIVKIHVLVNASWYDPNAYLADSGDFIIHSAGSNGYSVSDTQNKTLANVSGFFEIVAANLRAGLINASEVVTGSLIVTTDTIIINGQNLKDYIAGVVRRETGIISPIVRTNQLATDIINPLSSDSGISISLHDSQFIVYDSRDASGSAVAAIDNEGNASFSGTINSLSLETNDASISGTLRAGSIVADSIAGLEAKISTIYSANFADLASYSAQLSYVPDLAAERAQINQGLMVFGPTSLSDLSIAGNLSIGGTMFVTENSIETLGIALSLQSLRQGGLSIMGGLIYIDTDGNLKTQGDVLIGGKLAVNTISPLPASDLVINNASGSSILSINQTGDIIASGSGTFSKLNFSLIQPVLAVSATELIASSSAGAAKINPYQTEITIRNALVTDKSVIYITPVGTPSAQTPFLMRQVPDGTWLRQQFSESNSEQVGSFTVGVEAPNKNPIPFNWLIVN